MNPITETVYRFICAYVRAHGYPPSQREIAAACYLAQSSVHLHLRKLRAQGRLVWEPGKARSLRVAASLENTNDQTSAQY